MKKIQIILVAASLMMACDKTVNEQGIVDIFIGDEQSNTLRPNVYDRMMPTQNVYLQEFDNAATSGWSNKNDEYSQQGHENGELVILGKKTHYAWLNYSGLNQTYDFQMEIRVQFNFITVSNTDTYMGIVWGVDNDKKTYHYLSLFNNANHTMHIGHYDGKNYTNLFAQASNLAKNTHHIFTIRKVGNNMYFFANKRFIYQTAYSSFPFNYGFLITASGIVFVDYVKIDYIEHL